MELVKNTRIIMPIYYWHEDKRYSAAVYFQLGWTHWSSTKDWFVVDERVKEIASFYSIFYDSSVLRRSHKSKYL